MEKADITRVASKAREKAESEAAERKNYPNYRVMVNFHIYRVTENR